MYLDIWQFTQDFIIAYFNIFIEMAPYFMLGIVFTIIIKAYIPTSILHRHLGKKHWSSSIKAVLIGVPLPLCSCGVVPTGLGLQKSGASKSATVSFLISTPQTGIDSIFTTYGLLGLPMAILRPIVAFFNGIMGGLLVHYTDAKSKHSKEFNEEPTTEPNTTLLQATKFAFVDFLQDIWQPLLVGILLSALLTVLLPDNWFETYQSWLYYPFVLLISVPLYVCATGSIPIAMTLMMKGISPGAAMLFLIAGPATNIASINILKKALGLKTLSIYIGSIIIGAIIFALVIDFLLPSSWFAISNFSMALESHQHEENIFLNLINYTSSIILSLAIGYHIYLAIFKKFTSKAKQNIRKGSTVFNVKGMTCGNCERTVSNAIEKLPFINDFNINRLNGELIIHGDKIDREKILHTIDNLGFIASIKK